MTCSDNDTRDQACGVGTTAAMVAAAKAEAQKAGATFKVIAPMVEGALGSGGQPIDAQCNGARKNTVRDRGQDEPSDWLSEHPSERQLRCLAEFDQFFADSALYAADKVPFSVAMGSSVG